MDYFTIAYDQYLCASEDGGLGDSVEGICIYTDACKEYPDMIVALDSEGIAKFYKNNPNTELDIYEGVYNFVEQRIDVFGELEDINAAIEHLKGDYPVHANLRPQKITRI